MTLFRCRLALSRNGRGWVAAHRAIVRAGVEVCPAPVPPAGRVSARGLGRCGCRPAEARQLTRGGDGGHGGVFSALSQPVVDSVEAVLGAPGDLEDVVRLALLTVLESRADPGWALIVPGRFDQKPAGVTAAGLGDRAALARFARLGQRRDETDPRRELVWTGEAMPVADLALKGQRGQRVDATEAA